MIKLAVPVQSMLTCVACHELGEGHRICTRLGCWAEVLFGSAVVQKSRDLGVTFVRIDSRDHALKRINVAAQMVGFYLFGPMPDNRD